MARRRAPRRRLRARGPGVRRAREQRPRAGLDAGRVRPAGLLAGRRPGRRAGRTRIAGAAITGGWLLVIAADLVIVPLVPRPWVVPALGLGNTAGLIAGGLALLAMVRRARGGAAQTGRHPGLRRGAFGRAGRGSRRCGCRIGLAGPRVRPQCRRCAARLCLHGARLRPGGSRACRR